MKKLFILLTLVCIVAMSVTAYGKSPNVIQPKNEIWYTSKDGAIVEPCKGSEQNIPTFFGANIVSNTYQNGKGVIVFDGDVTRIVRAFERCNNLTSITIPNSVTLIGRWAFSWCESLTSVTIPDGVTKIDVRAFTNCTSLISITIPNSVTTIGDSAFFSCTSLTKVTIGDSITSISGHAFLSCESLASIYCKASTPPSLGDSMVFACIASDCKLYVPITSVEIYKRTWTRFYNATVGYDF